MSIDDWSPDSRQLGERSEAAVINAVPQLEYVPDSENQRVDARMTAVFTPGSEIDSAGPVVVEAGTLVEIKSCAAVYGDRQRRGRFHLRRAQHEYLEENGGLYLLAVSAPNSRDVVAATVATPNAVRQELVESWIDTNDRPAYSKVAWSRVFEPSEVNP
jgi:hypothetical protein